VRRLFVNCILIAFIAGSAYDTVTDQEHWPFSQYPMFSGVWSQRSFTWLRLFGVTGDGREFALDANRFIAPFDQSRLPKVLQQMLDKPDGDQRIRIALPELYARYEQLRHDEQHDGPPIVALRLYELDWIIRPDAANVDAPEGRRLIAEVRP
jgi:hypothetical protein